jgi:RNA polymerase sigma-54 factor
MKPSLQLRTSQHLALTPQLQQSIRLLQLSTLEMHQELEQMLADNPLLERLDDPLDNSVRLLADGTYSGPESTLPSTMADASTPSAPASEGFEGEHDTPEQHHDDSTWSFEDTARASYSADDEDARPQLEAQGMTLREHLLEQARVTARTTRDLGLLTVLIDALNEQGYLEESLEDIHAYLPEELDIEIEELATALKLLQNFDPVGVAARSPAECLTLQLQQLPKVPFVIRRLALQIVDDYLSLFAQRDFNKIKKALDCDDEDLREVQAAMQRCYPHPGALYASESTDYVVADVIIQYGKQGWYAALNSHVIPNMRINALYANALRNSKTDGVLSTQLQEAKWLIKNMRQRFDTILRVSQAIVERQRNFFTHGAVAMKPLVLREIADTLGLHESTISRVTTQKFMLTPHGMFELKYFFGSHVATETGGEASSTAIRALIKQLIGEENPKQPLSDSKIADMLAEQGMVVARRTVAKYREILKIPPVTLRKSL